MNIETKHVRGNYNDYRYFGWSFKEDVRVRHGKHHVTEHVLVRDRDIENYQYLRVQEQRYFALKAEKKYYEPIDPFICLIALLLGILPGVIYIALKSNQKANIEAHNNKIQLQMNTIIKEVNSH